MISERGRRSGHRGRLAKYVAKIAPRRAGFLRVGHVRARSSLKLRLERGVDLALGATYRLVFNLGQPLPEI